MINVNFYSIYFYELFLDFLYKFGNYEIKKNFVVLVEIVMICYDVFLECFCGEKMLKIFY